MDREDSRALSRARARSATIFSSPSGSRKSACSIPTANGTVTSFTSEPSSLPITACTTCGMTVPRGWPLAATGRERERTDNADGTTTHRYYQEDVHDFAWTTSPDFVERRERFEHPGLPLGRHAPDAAARTRRLRPARHFEATRAALRHYGEWFGPYPTGTSRSSIRHGESQSDGMEYPTLFTAGTAWLTPREDTYLEDVTVHEAGHQWWYGIVGTNEFEDAWMDEGINQYANARVMAEAFPDGREVPRFFGGFVPWVVRRRAVGSRDLRRISSRLSEQPDRRRAGDAIVPVLAAHLRPDDATRSRRSGCTRSSARSAGRRYSEILATFFDRWKFKHPDARRSVPDRQRSEPPRSHALLRSGVSRLRRLRLRRRERLQSGKRSARRVSHATSSSGDTATASFR